jgi:ketosteroid isomerase-like protein
MLTEIQARTFAEHWIQAFNSHNLDEILAHYAEEIVLVSPIAARLLNDPIGTVTGKTALRAYFQTGLAAYPDLKFTLIEVMWGLSSVVLCYVNQNGIKAGEYMEIDAAGKVAKVIANYN